jgi:hypothetical protein
LISLTAFSPSVSRRPLMTTVMSREARIFATDLPMPVAPPGTTQLSYSGGSYHFTDGFGNYRTYDNPNDTPENHNENGTWQLMTAAK